MYYLYKCVQINDAIKNQFELYFPLKGRVFIRRKSTVMQIKWGRVSIEKYCQQKSFWNSIIIRNVEEEKYYLKWIEGILRSLKQIIAENLNSK